MIKSPLRYPGGKSRAVDLLATLIPDFSEFREPFFGGGSLFFYLKQKLPRKTFWVNDLYFELFTFWKVAQEDCAALIKKVCQWRKQYRVGKELFRFLNDNLARFDEIELAAAFFIYNRITFSGTSLSGGFSEAAFSGRFTESSIERLRESAKIIRNTKITNFDYSALINADGEKVFLFLDPPYYSATKSALYGKRGKLHTTFDHQAFAQTMKTCRHKWLITYDDCEYIRDLFGFANIRSWNLTYGMRNVTAHSNQNGKEIFIANYPLTMYEQQISLLS